MRAGKGELEVAGREVGGWRDVNDAAALLHVCFLSALLPCACAHRKSHSAWSRDPSLTASPSQDYGIMKVGKDLLDLQIQPSTHHHRAC